MSLQINENEKFSIAEQNARYYSYANAAKLWVKMSWYMLTGLTTVSSGQEGLRDDTNSSKVCICQGPPLKRFALPTTMHDKKVVSGKNSGSR